MIESPHPSLSPWQLLYGGAHWARRRWHRHRASTLPRPVISVGNLSWGGSGKTPLVAAIARHLRDSGRSVCVLSRGYRSKGEGVRVVSVGEGPLLGPSIAGDEPVALAGELPGVSVVVSPDRWKAGRHALETMASPPDCFLLDDGFSHVRLARDIDLLVFPAGDPFAGGRLPPAGRLREPLKSARHASAVILAGFDEETESSSGSDLAAALRKYGFEGPGFSSRTRSLEVVTERGGSVPSSARVLLVAGIARPDRFGKSVERLGFDVADQLEFGDHHHYDASDIEQIEDRSAAIDAAFVLTTTKDYVKLLGRLEVPLAHLPIRTEPEPSFWTWLEKELGGFE